MTKWLWKAWVQQHEDGQYPSPVLFLPTLCLACEYEERQLCEDLVLR